MNAESAGFTPMLVARVSAEIQRVAIVSRSRLSDVAFIVATSGIAAESFLSTVVEWNGEAMADCIREYGSCRDGVVWPASRARVMSVCGDAEGANPVITTAMLEIGRDGDIPILVLFDNGGTVGTFAIAAKITTGNSAAN